MVFEVIRDQVRIYYIYIFSDNNYEYVHSS
jgi:hypothetical protein